jgi:hypothetical protein
VADAFNGPVKVKLGVVGSAVAAAADLFHDAARALSAQADDKAVTPGPGLLNMALSGTVAGFALYARAAFFRIAARGIDAGHKAVRFGRACGAAGLQRGMRG